MPSPPPPSSPPTRNRVRRRTRVVRARPRGLRKLKPYQIALIGILGVIALAGLSYAVFAGRMDPGPPEIPQTVAEGG